MGEKRRMKKERRAFALLGLVVLLLFLGSFLLTVSGGTGHPG